MDQGADSILPQIGRESKRQKLERGTRDEVPGTEPPGLGQGLVDESPRTNGDAIMWHDFRQFTMRGNVVDMAVGIVIGAA